MNKNITVFMYHDIRNLKDTTFKERYKLKSFLRKKKFIEQINFIQKKFTIITTDDLIYHDSFKENINYAVITFDDGLIDQYNFVEFLNKKNIRATFFLPSKSIVDRVVFHSHKIQFILASCDNKILTDQILSYFKTSERETIYHQFSVSSWKNNIWTKEMVFITSFLRNFNSEIKYTICNDLFNKYVTTDERSLANDLYMTENECKDLLRNNMIVGGHGHQSVNLKTLTYQEQYNDINNNYDFLKKLFQNQNFNFIFSYPNGGYNSNTIKILKNLDCKLAFTTKNEKINNSPNLKINRMDATKYDFN